MQKKRFDQYDTSSGGIQESQANEILQIIFKGKMTDSLIKRLVSMHLSGCDHNKNGIVDFEEFVEVYTKLKEQAK